MFINELKRIYEESKPYMEELQAEFKKTQEESANRFMREFVFPKIKEEYQKTPWVGRFQIELIFQDSVWTMRNHLVVLGRTWEYMYNIAHYIPDIARNEGIKVLEAGYDEGERYYILMEFKVHK